VGERASAKRRCVRSSTGAGPQEAQDVLLVIICIGAEALARVWQGPKVVGHGVGLGEAGAPRGRDGARSAHLHRRHKRWCRGWRRRRYVLAGGKRRRGASPVQEDHRRWRRSQNFQVGR
jgi:hypothetical protein